MPGTQDQFLINPYGMLFHEITASSLMKLLEQQKPQQTNKILLKANNRLFLVDQKDICFASIEDGVITVVTAQIEGQSNCRTLEELLSSLDALEWPERVKIMQRNWIGKSEGAEFELPERNARGREVAVDEDAFAELVSRFRLVLDTNRTAPAVMRIMVSAEAARTAADEAAVVYRGSAKFGGEGRAVRPQPELGRAAVRLHRLDDARDRLVVLVVFPRHLRFTVRTKVRKPPVLAHLGEAHGQLVGQRNRGWHQLGILVAGVTEHHALVAGALFFAALLFLGVDAHRNVRRLTINGRKHRAGARVEHEPLPHPALRGRHRLL